MGNLPYIGLFLQVSTPLQNLLPFVNSGALVFYPGFIVAVYGRDLKVHHPLHVCDPNCHVRYCQEKLSLAIWFHYHFVLLRLELEVIEGE